MKNGHGHASNGKCSPTYRSWQAMRNRCENKNRQEYPRYGGRGITVCARWQVFENFLADMGERPPNTSLDRIDNCGNYYPANCRWATTKEQNCNRRSNKFHEMDGRRMILEDWARATGISPTTINDRLRRGWSLCEALTRPARPVNTVDRFVVRIVSPSGTPAYLSRGREVQSLDAAAHYPSPSHARVAADGFLKRNPRLYVDVIDSRDPERYIA